MASDGLPRLAQFTQAGPIANMAGDVTGNNTASVVSKLKSYSIGAGAPTADNDVLKWNVSANAFQFGPLDPSVGGDISGSLASATVVAIRGGQVTSAARADGNLMEWNAGGAQWGYVSPSGDISGKISAATVAKIQGRSVATTAPSDGEVLTWSTSNNRWQPGPSGGGISTWDALYANDKHLAIDAAVLEWEHTANLGVGFRVYRDHASANSDSPIMIVDNVNAGDDQPALQVKAKSGGTTAVFSALENLAVSTGMLANAHLAGSRSYLTPNAGDAANSYLVGYKAELSGTGGSATKIGFYSGANFTYGLYTVSKAYIEGGVTTLTVHSTSATPSQNVLLVDSATTGSFTVKTGGYTAITGTDADELLYAVNTLTNVAGSISTLLLEQSRSANFTQDGKNVFNAMSVITGHVSDTSTARAIHAAYRAEFTGTLPSDTDVEPTGLSVGGGFRYGLYSETKAYIADSTTPLTVHSTSATPSQNILQVDSATTGSFVVKTGGYTVITGTDASDLLFLSETMTNISGDISVLRISQGRSVDFTVDGKDVQNIRSIVVSRTGDTTATPTFNAAYKAEFSGDLPTDTDVSPVGLYATSGFRYGVYSDSPGAIRSSIASIPGLIVGQSAGGNILELRSGSVPSEFNRLWVYAAGTTFISADHGTDPGLTVAQNNTASKILSLKGGVPVGGTERVAVSYYGLTTLTPANDYQAISAACTLTNSAGNWTGCFVYEDHSVDLTQDGRSVYAYKGRITGRAGDTSSGTALHAVFRAEINGVQPSDLDVQMIGLSVQSGFMYGVYSAAPIAIDANIAIPGFTVAQAFANQPLFRVIDGTIAAGTTRFTIADGGAITHDNVTGSTAVTIGQSATGDILVLKDGTAGAGTTRAQFCEDGCLNMTVNSANPGLVVDQLSTGALFQVKQGGTWKFQIINGGVGSLDGSSNTWAGFSINQSGTAAIFECRDSGQLVFAVNDTGYTFVDVNNAAVAFTIAQAGAGRPFVIKDGTYAAGTERFSISDAGPIVSDVDSGAAAFTIGQSGAGRLFVLKDGTAAAGIERFAIGKGGTVTISPASDTQIFNVDVSLTNSAGDFAAFTMDVSHAVDLTQTGKDVYGFKTTVYGRLGDASVGRAIHAAYRAEFSGDLPTDTDVQMIGLSVGSGLSFGFYSESPNVIEVNNIEAGLDIYQAGAGSILKCRYGTRASSTERFMVYGSGTTRIDAVSSSTALTVSNDSTGSLLQLKDGTYAGGTNRLTVTKTGSVAIGASGNDVLVATTTSNVDGVDVQFTATYGASWTMNTSGSIVHAARNNYALYTGNPSIENTYPTDYAAHTLTENRSVDLTQDGKDVFMYKGTIVGRTGDASVGRAIHAVYRAVFSGSIPTDADVEMIGLSVASGFKYGFYSESESVVAANTTTRAFAVYQQNTGYEIAKYASGTVSTNTLRYVLYASGLARQDVNDANTALTISQEGAGKLLELKDGTFAGGTTRFEVTKTGITSIVSTGIKPFSVTTSLAGDDLLVSMTATYGASWVISTAGAATQSARSDSRLYTGTGLVSNASAADYTAFELIESRSVDLTQNNKDVFLYQGTIVGRTGDTSVGKAIHAVYRALFSGSLPTDTDVQMVGLSVASGFSYGIYSESPNVLEVNHATTTALDVYQAGNGAILRARNGTLAVPVDRLTVYASGTTTLDANNNTLAGLTVAQSGSGPILELKDGLISGGTTRFTVAENGLVTVTSTGANSLWVNSSYASLGEHLVAFNATAGGNWWLHNEGWIDHTAKADTALYTGTASITNASDTDYVGHNITESRSVDLTQNGKDVFLYKGTIIGRTGDTTTTTTYHAVYRAEFSGSAPSDPDVKMVGLSVSAGFTYGLYSDSDIIVRTSSGNPTAIFGQASTGNIIQGRSGSPGAETTRFSVRYSGATALEVNDDTYGGLIIGQSGTSNLIQLKEGTVGSGTVRLVVTNAGKLSMFVANQNAFYINGSYGVGGEYLVHFGNTTQGSSLDFYNEGWIEHIAKSGTSLYSGGCSPTNTSSDYEGFSVYLSAPVALTQDSKDVYGFYCQLTDRVDSTSTTITYHAAYRASFTGTLPTDLDISTEGFSAGSGFRWGVDSKSPVLIDVSSTAAAFVISQASSGRLMILQDGQYGAGIDRFTVYEDGRVAVVSTVVDAMVVTSSVTSQDTLVEFICSYGGTSWAFGTYGEVTQTAVDDWKLYQANAKVSNSTATDYAAYTLTEYRTADLTQDGRDVFLYKGIVKGHTNDVSVGTARHAAFRADFTGTLATDLDVRSEGLSVGAGFSYGIDCQSVLLVDVSTAAAAFYVNQDGAGNLMALQSGAHGVGTSRFVVSKTGAITHTPANPTDPFTAFSTTLTSGILATGEAMTGHSIALTSSGSDAADALIYGLNVTLTPGSCIYNYGVKVGPNFTFGVHSGSSVWVENTGATSFLVGALLTLGTSSEETSPYEKFLSCSDNYAGGGSAEERFWIDQAGSVGQKCWSTSTAGYTLDFISNGMTGNTAALQVNATSAAADSDILWGGYINYQRNTSTADAIGLYVSGDWNTGIYVIPEVDGKMFVGSVTLTDAPSTDLSFVTINESRSVELTKDGRDIYGITVNLKADVDDTAATWANHAAFHANLNGTLPASFSNVVYCGLLIEGTLPIGVYSNACSFFLADPSADTFDCTVTVFNTAASGTSDTFRIKDGDLSTSDYRFRVRRGGQTLITSAVDAASTPAFLVENTWTTNEDGYIVQFKDASNDRFTVRNDGGIDAACKNDIGRELLNLSQTDGDQAFINFQGNSQSDFSGNISTNSSAQTLAGHVMIEVNGTQYWVQIYTPT